MILRPNTEDIKLVLYHMGRLIVGIGLLMAIPLMVSLLFSEWNPALDFAIGLFSCLMVGLVLQLICFTEKDLRWMHGLTIAAASWLAAMFLGAIPLFLSGHFGSYLDACFDAMSGFATTGLVLIQNRDHISFGLNMWRHLMMFIGGQGIIVIGLTFLIRGTAGAYRMYVGEAREERVLPNVVQTARFIWYVSLTYLILGTLALFAVGLYIGLPAIKSFFHGLWIFMAAFDTGGFTPQSQSILYYHSFPFELVTMTIMILGALNFGLHYALWTGNRREIYKNIETVTLFTSVVILFTLAIFGLTKVYPNFLAYFRKGFYQIISAHSGTGYMTIYAPQFVSEWGPLTMFITSIAMALGGCACSTAGGIKVLRIGIVIKALFQDIRRILNPGTALIIEKFHHLKDIILEEKYVRSSILIMLAYIFTYLLGTLVGLFYGYPLSQASFESISAAANVGLSCGITNPAMPWFLKVVYIIEMWVGRLEFMSVFALIGFIIARVVGVKGK